MKRSQFSEEQIVYALRQAEACTPIRICAASSASVTPPSMRGKRSTPFGPKSASSVAEPSCTEASYNLKLHGIPRLGKYTGSGCPAAL